MKWRKSKLTIFFSISTDMLPKSLFFLDAWAIAQTVGSLIPVVMKALSSSRHYTLRSLY